MSCLLWGPRHRSAPTGRCQGGPKVTSCRRSPHHLSAVRRIRRSVRIEQRRPGSAHAECVGFPTPPLAYGSSRSGNAPGGRVPTLHTAIRVHWVMAVHPRRRSARLSLADSSVAVRRHPCSGGSLQRPGDQEPGGLLRLPVHGLHAPIERSNDPTVVTPFSIGGRNYPANIAMELFATDLNTNPNETFGPFVVTTDAEGRFCQRVNQARPTHWKIDLVEPPPGETDSKVITVELPEAVVPTLPTLPSPPRRRRQQRPRRARPQRQRPRRRPRRHRCRRRHRRQSWSDHDRIDDDDHLDDSSAYDHNDGTDDDPARSAHDRGDNDVPGQATTTAATGQTTTTLAGQTTTTAATTTVAGQTTTTAAGATTSAPEQDLGFEIEPVPVPPEGILPATGATGTSELTAIALGAGRGRRGHILLHRSEAQSGVTWSRSGLCRAAPASADRE